MRKFGCSTTTVGLTLIMPRNTVRYNSCVTISKSLQSMDRLCHEKICMQHDHCEFNINHSTKRFISPFRQNQSLKPKNDREREREREREGKRKKSFLRSGDPNGMKRVLRRGLAFFPFPSDLSKWKNHAEVILSIRSSWAVMESSLAPVT